MSGERFLPAPGVAGFHRQTLFAALLRFQHLRGDPAQECRWLQVDEHTRVALHMSWARSGAAPTLLLVHGMCGSARSNYMLGTTRLALRAGLHVARLDLRGARTREAQTEWLGHAGQIEDLAVAVDALQDEGRVSALTLAGFSMGGNIVLRLGSHWGARAPSKLRSLVAVSAAADLHACQSALDGEPGLRVYRDSFLRRLKRFVRVHAKLHGERPWTAEALVADSLLAYDAAGVCPVYDFSDPLDYYTRASALHELDALRVPTLALHALDDRMVPCGPSLVAAAARNPALTVELAQRGGHCAFVGRTARKASPTHFWAEARVVEHALASGL
ncbi:MAG: alpha/beta hydrolase [Planctomycetota bacterium]|nr:MAG: alpha/beta hydrolase [Planctomycetota bacterium]